MLLTSEEIQRYLNALAVLPEGHSDIAKIKFLFAEDKRERCRNNFLPFVKEMWGGFIAGKHHKDMAEAFERVADGTLKRLIINMPPRHTKSEFASYLLPAWFLGKFPEKKIIETAHTAELAVGFGRKVRNLVATPEYQAIFPTKLSTDSKAAGRWNTNKGGDYFAIGVGGAVTGKGADLLIIDDPHSEQEAMQGTANVYDRVYEWYNSGPRQRLQPGGAIIIVMCMTGDTNVLMADGSNTQLKDIRQGDMVATFDKGHLGVSKINHWKSSGVDSIYTIQTQSGIILHANERHPFLVFNDGIMEWTRLKDLKAGMLLVATKDAIDLQGHKQSLTSVPLANQKKATTEKTQTHHINLSDTTENGLENNVDAANQLLQKDSVTHAIQRNIHQKNPLQNKTGLGASNTGTGLPLSNTKQWWKNAKTYAMFVENRLQTLIQERIGTKNSALTTTMTQEKSEDFCAMTATLPLDTERHQKFLNELHRISDFTIDPIVSIIPSGQEEVFDVEVDRTENFIANGVVSHNTRWSKKDLTGQIIMNEARRGGDPWEVIEFPALMPSGKPLWPEFWSQKELEAIKTELPVSKWEAQYQQNPTSEEGAIIKRESWKIWEEDYPPQCDYVIQSWDTAFEKNNRADFSACTTWGIFYQPNQNGDAIANIILLEAIKERLEFPELKTKAMQQFKEWNPDTCIVEKKAAGAPLIYEMRRMGIPISEYTPSKGSDKIARVNAISDLFASGLVWCPDTRWAEEVMEECASFPNGEHDDLVDSTSQALLRFRQGGFIRLETDEPDEPLTFKRKVVYY